MKNNKGISYIELVLVMSIALILTGLATISYGMIKRTNVSKAADRTLSKINEARSEALVKGSDKGIVAFCVKNGAIYCYVGQDIDSADLSKQKWEKLCSSPATLTVQYKDGSTAKLGNGSFVKTKFKQSTGEIQSGIIHYTFNAGNSNASVKVYKATGKAVLD